MVKVEKFTGDIEAVKRGAKSKYPFAEMQVGDCFKVKTNEGMRSQSSAAGKRHGFKFRVINDGIEMTIVRIA